jgi:hypothetical protein
VPISAIANFKRIKGLCKDVGAITDALCSSTALSVDAAGMSVRRTAPLPAFDVADICARTVVAEHLPDKQTIGALCCDHAGMGCRDGAASVCVCVC